MKSYRNFGWSLFVMLLIVSGAWATTYNVPGDYGTIQAAINAATDGDIINVAAGTYVENLIIAKDLTVQGAGVGVTIIDANASPGRGIESEPANFAPGWDIVLEDFTLIGPTQTGGNGYGIKLAGDIATAIITDVEVYGSAKSGVDLNGLASGTITNLYSHDNLNRGLQLTDCDNITINGLTTSGNPWGGAVVATKGAAFTGGSDGVTFTGALSLAETTPILSERNAPSYPAITNLAVPTAPFDYLVGTTANVYVQGYYTDASAALGWGAGAWAKNRVNGHFEVIPGLTIQAAINAASAGDIIDVAAGTYAENIDVNKRVEIIGAGATTVITQNPAGAGSSQVGVVQLTASGISGDPILLKDLRIEPQGMAGISVGLFTLATGQTVEYVSLDNVDVIGTATDFTTEQERGLYVDNSSTLRYLDVVDCQFNDLMYGWYFHKVANAVDASTVQWVTVSTTTFNHNTQKGVYAEKLADASFTQCTIDNNGFNSAPLPSWFAPWSCGVDLNLKNGSYSNFLFDDCDVTNNAHDEAKEGVGLAVKGRGTGNDPSYVAYPAYVDNVDITNCTISDNERGLRFGEPGKANTTPTNVYVYHNTF